MKRNVKRLLIISIIFCSCFVMNSVHADEIVSRKNPTCTEDGYIEYKPTGTVAVEPNYKVTIPSLGHSYEKTVIQKQTCTEKGIIRYTCSRCGDTYDEVLAKLGHNYKLETIEPTCIEKGKNIYTCSRCEDSYEEEIEVLGHDFKEQRIEPDCENEGKIIHTCNRCGEVEEEIIPALGHKYNDWIIEEEPTLFKVGSRYKICKECNDEYFEEIPKKKFSESKPAMIIAAVSGIGALTAGIFVTIKSKATIQAGTKALKVKPKLKLPKKTVFICLKENEINTSFVDLLKTKPQITIKLIPFSELDSISDQVKIVQPSLVVFDIDGEEDYEKVLKEIKEVKASYSTNFGIIVNFIINDNLKNKLEELKNNGTILSYTTKEDALAVRFVKLILPLYKLKKNKTGIANNVGIIADSLGVPYVSRLTDLYKTYKNDKSYIDEIKKQLDKEEISFSETLALISNIASIVGFDEAREVSTIIEDIKSKLDYKSKENA